MISVDTIVLRARLEAAIEANWASQVSWLQRLVRFPSLRGQERDCQKWIASEFRAREWATDVYALSEVDMSSSRGHAPAFEVDYDNSLQVVATLPAERKDGKSLILQGHVDVVPEGPADMWSRDPFSGDVVDGWLHGRGANDMKAGVSAMVFALDALKSAGLKPASEVIVQTVTEEESTGNGALSTLVRGYRADGVLIPEPSGNRITRVHVGVLWFRLRVRGEPVHVAVADTGSNAILSMMGLVGALQATTARWNAAGKDYPWYDSVPDPLKFNPGVIRGGDWPSSTPAWCELDCRIGVLPGTDLAEARADILRTVADASRDDPFLRDAPAEVLWTGFDADGYLLEPGSPAEETLNAAHRAVFGEDMGDRRSTGVNDTRFYALYYGIPALCYGPLGHGNHAYNEATDLEALKRTTLVIALFIAGWCGVTEKTEPIMAGKISYPIDAQCPVTRDHVVKP